MGDVSKELNSILNDDKDYVEEEKSSKTFIFLLIIFVAITYFVILFLNSQEEKNTVSKKSIKKTILVEKEIKTQAPLQIKEKIKETAKVLEKQKNIIETVTKVDKTNFYKIYNSNNKKVLKCYDYAEASFTPSKSCLKSLKEFLDKNKDALRYQIVSVIAESDIVQYKRYNKNIQDLLLNGLSIKRVTELTWYIKKTIGNNIILTSNNYYVKSKKDNRGIILKAYF